MDRFEAFTLSILELNRYLQKIKDLEMRRFGLRASHVMCLYHLARAEDGLTSAQLCDACKEDKAAISRSIKELITKGLVFSETPEDKRPYRVRLRLTEDGRDISLRMDERIAAALDYGGNGLTPQQRSVLYAAMERIEQNLSDYLEQQEYN